MPEQYDQEGIVFSFPLRTVFKSNVECVQATNNQPFLIPVDVLDNYQILCVYFHVSVDLTVLLSLNNIFIRSFVLM